MATLSAFADEIAPDLQTQIDVCEANGVRCIDVRAIDGVNVSKFTDEQAGGYARQLADRGFTVPCIGSPIGKVTIDKPFAEHLDLLKRCFDVADALGTRAVRVFSFYPPEGEDIADHRDEVIRRMTAMVDAAEAADMVLWHENEKAIYGAKPAGVKDIFASVRSERLKGIFDPANYVEEGIAPHDEGWSRGLAEITDWFHVKDKVPGADACVPAGKGHGQIPQTLADAARRGYDGYLTLEPHMKVAGHSSGFTGPEKFAEAVAALRAVCEQVGLSLG